MHRVQHHLHTYGFRKTTKINETENPECARLAHTHGYDDNKWFNQRRGLCVCAERASACVPLNQMTQHVALARTKELMKLINCVYLYRNACVCVQCGLYSTT